MYDLFRLLLFLTTPAVVGEFAILQLTEISIWKLAIFRESVGQIVFEILHPLSFSQDFPEVLLLYHSKDVGKRGLQRVIYILTDSDPHLVTSLANMLRWPGIQHRNRNQQHKHVRWPKLQNYQRFDGALSVFKSAWPSMSDLMVRDWSVFKSAWLSTNIDTA